MAHIKWVGIIKTEIAEYQKGHLDSKAMKMELPATMKAMMIKALPFVIVPFVTIFLSLFIKTFFAGQVIISPVFFIIGFVASFMGLISPYPDCYNVYQVLKQTPSRCYIQNYGDDTYWIK